MHRLRLVRQAGRTKRHGAGARRAAGDIHPPEPGDARRRPDRPARGARRERRRHPRPLAAAARLRRSRPRPCSPRRTSACTSATRPAAPPSPTSRARCSRSGGSRRSPACCAVSIVCCSRERGHRSVRGTGRRRRGDGRALGRRPGGAAARVAVALSGAGDRGRRRCRGHRRRRGRPPAMRLLAVTSPELGGLVHRGGRDDRADQPRGHARLHRVRRDARGLPRGRA